MTARFAAFIRQLVATEPVAIVSAVVAVLGLVGVTVAAENQATAVQALVVLLPLLGGLLARQAVTPNATAEEGEQQAVADVLSAHAAGDLSPYIEEP